MSIGLRMARELRANELDKVSGGFVYLGNGDGFVRLPPPHTPPLPINPPTSGGGSGSGGGSSGGSGSGSSAGHQPIRIGGHGIYLF
jgi:hypothetical protein